MPKFSQASLAQLATCHKKLQLIANAAIKIFDFKVVEGFRNQADQHAAFLAGNSKLDWPNGNHNHNPSRAMDCYPWPVDFSDNVNNIQRFCYQAGIFKAVADSLGIKIRWGGDWNQNQDMRDEGSFRDYPHIELDKSEV
jgi:peptidoglycan L-alanyl-D-glutamate endopeptidase CwlK